MTSAKDTDPDGGGTALADVRKLAEQCGLGFSRIQAAIPKVKANTPLLKAKECWNDPGSRGWIELRGCLGYLMSRVPRDMICGIIETENIDAMGQRLRFLSEVTDPRTVIHPVEELQTLMKQFIGHLQDNKDHLLQTGYPLKRFLPSVWMDWRLTDLYRTKIPGGVTLRKGADHVVECSYHWTNARLPHPLPPSLNLGAPLAFGMGYEYCFPSTGAASVGLPQIALVSYEEAPQMDGLTLHQAYQLEKARPDIFALKLALLDQLHDALERRDPDSLRDNCINTIREHFSVAQVKFCWAMDMPKYLARYPRSTTMSQVPVGPVCGGLNSLLSVMERAELELRAGLMGKMRASLGESFIVTKNGTRYFKTVSHWFSKEETHVIDESMRLVARLREKDAALHDEIHAKWSRRLEEDLLVAVNVQARVPKSSVNETKKVFRNIALIAENAAKASQTQVETRPPKQKHLACVPQNEFRQDGSDWILNFNGKSIPVRHKRGFEYLQILIRNPGTVFSCTDLRALAGKQRERFDRLQEDTDDDPGTNPPRARAYTEDLDNEVPGAALLIKNCKPSKLKWIKWTLEKKLKESEDELDQVELTKIRKYLHSVCDALESLGPEYTGRDRDRTYVGNSITRAIRAIKYRHEALAKHLDENMDRGFSFTYRPSPPVKWRTV